MSNQPYFTAAGTKGGTFLELWEDPLRPGELMAVAQAGVTVRVRLDEEKAQRLATALVAWYSRPATDDEAAQDITTQYRDGLVYSFTNPPEV